MSGYFRQLQEILTGVFGQPTKAEILTGVYVLEHEALPILQGRPLHLLNDIVILGHLKLKLIDHPHRILLPELFVAILTVLLLEDFLHLLLELEFYGWEDGEQTGGDVDHAVERGQGYQVTDRDAVAAHVL